MKKLLTAATCLVFLVLFVQGVGNAQQATTVTGDRKFDAQLKRINEEAKADPEGFVRRLSEKHGIPQQEILEAKEKYRLDDAGTYMATAVARRTNRRVDEVAAEYGQNQGKGWGVTAQRMGIKPGSPEFKQMKDDAKGHADYMKTMAKNKQKQQGQEMKKERGKGKKK
jgi:hypothetical protein